MSTSLLAAKVAEAAKARTKKGGADKGARAAARAILAAIKSSDEAALESALRSFSDIATAPPADDEED